MVGDGIDIEPDRTRDVRLGEQDVGVLALVRQVEAGIDRCDLVEMRGEPGSA